MLPATNIFTRAVGALLLWTAFANAPAASTNLLPVADTMLSEEWSSNNFGAVKFANSGTTQNFRKNRALYRFDIAGHLPPHSRIQSASLVLEVTKQPADGFNFADFGLHRLLRDWGEGNKTNPASAPDSGRGSPATVNEATWFYRLAETTNTWAAPGGVAGTDFIAEASAVNTVYGVVDSPYDFMSPQVAADVQQWLNDPGTNFGWILVCQSEDVDFTARRFSARENTFAPPQLNLEYVAAPRLEIALLPAGHLSLSFQAEADQTYKVEFRDDFAMGNWQTFVDWGLILEATNLIATDSLTSTQRCYRVVTE